MSAFLLNISTPEKVFYNGAVESVVLTTTEGEMGVLENHALTVVALETGPIRIKTAEGWRLGALSGGFAQITGAKLVILADTAEWPEDIEINRAEEAKHRAEERLRARRSEIEYVQSQVALKRAVNRLNIAKGKVK